VGAGLNFEVMPVTTTDDDTGTRFKPGQSKVRDLKADVQGFITLLLLCFWICPPLALLLPLLVQTLSPASFTRFFL
jgi:hypothetical protein